MKKITYIDLGLPSGTLWASSNSEICGKRHFMYNEAVMNFGKQMPTKEQFIELMHYGRWKWTELFGGKVNGYRVTGPNGKSIFLPTSGYYNGNSLYGRGVSGDYWATGYYNSLSGYSLFFSNDGLYLYGIYRYFKFSIRTVKIKCS